MGEGYVQHFVRSIQWILVLWFGLVSFVLAGLWWLLYQKLDLEPIVLASALLVLWLMVPIAAGFLVGIIITKPMRYMAQAILHIAPSEHLVAAPNVEKLGLGRELVTTLTRQIYNFASASNQQPAGNNDEAAALLEQIPVPVIGVSDQGVVVAANSRAMEMAKEEKLTGMKFDEAFKLTYGKPEDGASTLQTWIDESRTKSVAANKTWQKVELRATTSDAVGYFDIAASFSLSNSKGIETMLAFYSHADVYDAEEDSINFVALAVHELRTPLTVMRGYIEVFEDELGGGLNDEMTSFMHKMRVSADGLSAFVNNILSVARLEQNQMTLQLSEESWQTVLGNIVENLQMKAQVHRKAIHLEIAPDLPPAAIDRVTLSEVINNLVDNAIKYSPPASPDITIKSYLNQDGLIETTVADKGVGIPSSVMPHLFGKFYRNHRNRSQISGTGLGLYLSKAIVSAHGGNIWASSHEGEGSTFGFTILPYSKLAESQKNTDNSIIRKQHGWIKNHSLHRQ